MIILAGLIAVICLTVFGIKTLIDLQKPYPLTNLIEINELEMRSTRIHNSIAVSAEASKVLKKEISIPQDSDFLQVVAILSDFTRSKIRKGNSGLRCDFEDWNSPLLQEQEFPGDCSAYAKLFVLVANHFGYKSRVVWLFGHVSAEIYSNEHDSWLAVDVQNNSMFVDDEDNFVGYSSFVRQSKVEPSSEFYPIRLGKPTSNDPELLKTRNAWHYPKMLILDSETVEHYCVMKKQYIKVLLAIFGIGSIGHGYIFA